MLRDPRPTSQRAAVWGMRVAWVALALTAPALGDALSRLDHPVVAGGVLWVLWACGLLAMLVPSTWSLTVVRVLAPMVPVAAAVGWSGTATAPTLVIGVAVTALALTGEVGEAFVQASAYGSERRLPLRPPGALLVVVPLLWAIGTAGLVAGVVLLSDGSPVVGGVLTALAAGWTAVLLRRAHRLAMRWFVVVPAGLVVHDPLVLADTFMVSAAQVRELGLALADTDALDVTGGALGPAVEIALGEPATIVTAPDAAHPGGRAFHVTALLVSPTRPGRAIAAWQSR